jgi:hypothetical protein
MMDDKVLLAALRKLHARTPLPASQLTAAQRRELDRFARQTGAVSCQRQGRGDCYLVANPVLFITHLTSLSPGLAMTVDNPVPPRARHIADARDSKAGVHRHPHYYLLLKAVGEELVWREANRSIELPLGHATRHFGAATLAIDANDAWSSDYDLWLVENQALFDRTDWLPIDTGATVAYYGGQINGILLNWLGSRRRARRVMHFPDYDGVGLANFSRLHALLGDACQFWLMPDWAQKLDQYGSTQLWRDTMRDFSAASPLLPDYLTPLAEQMRQSGRALEQEAVWLPGA